MKNIRKSFGFTLIQLLFVIAIIGIITSIGMILMQQREQKFKVEKAALQMQQILQAALVYHIDNKCWPGSPASQCTIVPPATDPPSFNSYLPFGNAVIKDPWGEVIKWGSVAATDRFRVCTSDNSGGAIGSSITLQIAGLLPNAKSIPSGSGNCGNLDISNTCPSTSSNCVAEAEIKNPSSAGIGAGVAATNIIPIAAGSVKWNYNDLMPSGTCNATPGPIILANRSVNVATACSGGAQLKLVLFLGGQAEGAANTSGFTASAYWNKNVNNIKNMNYSYTCSPAALPAIGYSCVISAAVNAGEHTNGADKSFPLPCSDPNKKQAPIDQSAFATIAYLAYCE